MSSSPHLVEEFAGRNGKHAMLTTLKDLSQVTIDAKGKPYYNLEFFDRKHLLSDDIVDELSKDPTIGQVRINNVIEGPDINILPNGDIADTGKFSNDLVILKNRPIKSIHGNNGDFSMFYPNEKYYAEGGEVQPDPLEILERSRPKVAGIPINDRPLSGTDPIGEAMMWGLGGGAASAALRSLFPTYGATAAWLAFGDNNKDNMLVVPNNPVKNTTPIETGLLNKEVRQYYADDVLPRDILTSEIDKLRFLNTDKNFEYDLYPSEFFGDGVAGHYDHLADKIRLNGGYTTNKDFLDNVMSHEVNHRYNKEFPLDKEHNRMLNRAYTVEPNLNTPAARAARKPSEKRATNVNIRHKLQTDLRNTLGHNPTKAEMGTFIDSLSDQELLDRLGSASSYGSAYLMSIEDRADLVNQPADQYKKARVTALRKALKRIAMNEDKNDNNQNHA